MRQSLEDASCFLELSCSEGSFCDSFGKFILDEGELVFLDSSPGDLGGEVDEVEQKVCLEVCAIVRQGDHDHLFDFLQQVEREVDGKFLVGFDDVQH